MGVPLAIAAAFLWACTGLLNRVALERINPTQGTMFTMFSSFAISLIFVLVFERDSFLTLSAAAISWFLVMGIVNFPIGRYFNMLSIQRIGIARSMPVLGASPLFAVIMSVVLLGENPTIPIGIGAVCVIAGLYLVVTDRSK